MTKDADRLYWHEVILSPAGEVLCAHELALHEASHAIVAVDLGRRVLWVEIDPERSRGEMVPETPWHAGAQRAAGENLIIAMAGSAGQCKVNGWKPNRWTHEGTKDREIAYAVAGEFGLDPEDFAHIVKMLNRRDIWNKIEGLSRLLVKRNRIHTCETDFFRFPARASVPAVRSGTASRSDAEASLITPSNSFLLTLYSRSLSDRTFIPDG
jgi:hypothetical protein